MPFAICAQRLEWVLTDAFFERSDRILAVPNGEPALARRQVEVAAAVPRIDAGFAESASVHSASSSRSWIV
jgi:hypothetical protein